MKLPILSYTDKRWMAAALVAAAVISGCSNKTDEEPAEAAPLILTADSPASRSASPLVDKYTDFGVWAWKTDAENSLAMVLGRSTAADAGTEYYTHLTAEGAWTYVYSDASATQYERFWDQSATNYYFAAYAPYKANDANVNVTHAITATTSGVSIPAVAGDIAATEGIDWLEALWHRKLTAPIGDVDLISDESKSLSAYNDIVPLTFHHLLATTEFRIYAGSGTAPVLQSISIEMDDGDKIYALADYAAGTWSYTDASATAALYSLATPLDLTGTSKEDYLTLTTLLQLPQDVAGRTLRVTATLAGGAQRVGRFTIPEGWVRETKYIYYLGIGNDPIMISAAAEPWILGEDISVTEPVTNW